MWHLIMVLKVLRPEARSVFRSAVKQHNIVFTHEKNGTPEYDDSLSKVKKIISAWEKVEPLYSAKDNVSK